MKAFLVILLAPILWAERADSLHCHVCNSMTAESCTNPVNCSATDRFCTTFMRNNSTAHYLLEKRCSPTCPLLTIPNAVARLQSSFLCCQEDLCNGAGNVRLACPALVVALLSLVPFAGTSL